ncbi:MAG TPA: hybrid sensor histidine kinase/response regulator [Melioribacteraceae bacterium]|nr:hybrid sensor histidine kinase/response regulator [Melioribacteraceae bacterium]
MSEKFNKNGKVLIVDDNPKNLQYAAKVLTDAGYEISVAQSGINALNYINRAAPLPELILLDIMMPEMSGYEVCEKLKSSSLTKDIPVIFLTAKTEIDDIVKGFDLGGVDYITKPFQPKEILARIKTHIDLIRTKKELEEKNDLLNLYNKSLIDQIKERTNELIAAHNNIEKYKELKSNFLAQISHEIRTPVNVIINFLTLLRLEAEENGTAKTDNELFNSITSASKRLIRTIEMIVTMSELQKNIYQIDKTPTYVISEILYPIIENFDAEFKTKNLQLFTNISAFNQLAEIDKDSVFIILNNIIDNAIKYTPKGSVTVTAQNYENNKLYIIIEDSGIGISQEFLSSIYLPFSQEDEGYTRRFEGNGLGLPITKRLCELNNISFNINSEKGTGTKITLIFEVK